LSHRAQPARTRHESWRAAFLLRHRMSGAPPQRRGKFGRIRAPTCSLARAVGMLRAVPWSRLSVDLAQSWGASVLGIFHTRCDRGERTHMVGLGDLACDQPAQLRGSRLERSRVCPVNRRLFMEPCRSRQQFHAHAVVLCILRNAQALFRLLTQRLSYAGRRANSSGCPLVVFMAALRSPKIHQRHVFAAGEWP
jgi:hypothetical protein